MEDPLLLIKYIASAEDHYSE